MASYMQSNQPYNRVDDGIGAGLIAGAAMGGVASGTANLTRRGATAASVGARNHLAQKYTGLEAEAGMLPSEAQTKKLNKISKNMTRASNAEGLIGKAYQTTHGSGKRKAITMAGSIIGGAIAGGTIDGLNG